MKRNVIRNAVVLLVVVVAVIGCTSYQPHAATGGYQERHRPDIGPNVYEVWFSGNYYTGMDRIDDYNLFRCAEFTIEQGARYFDQLDIAGGSSGYASRIIRLIAIYDDAPPAGSYNALSVLEEVYHKRRELGEALKAAFELAG